MKSKNKLSPPAAFDSVRLSSSRDQARFWNSVQITGRVQEEVRGRKSTGKDEHFQKRSHSNLPNFHSNQHARDFEEHSLQPHRYDIRFSIPIGPEIPKSSF
jgi:hypothetical protein